MIRIGILGDIGAGKSYIAKNFGYPVFNADKEVGNLYKKNKKVFIKLKKVLSKYIYTFPISKTEITAAILSNKTNLKKIIKKLQEKDWAVCVMAEFGIEFKDAGFKDEVAIPEIGDLRNWAGLIKYADHFLGCDSVGQHLAKAMETPASVVMGATYPINTSYPDDKSFKIIDMGQFDREYDPIRISFDERISRKHERIMSMTPEIEDYVVSAVNGDPIEE